MLAIDSALQGTCAELRDQAARGQITAAECDLLIDGAILLANALLRDPLPIALGPERRLSASGLNGDGHVGLAN
jgi:hypothetical protein